MKNSITKAITTICAVVLTVNASAQHRSRGNESMASNNGNKNNSTQKHFGGSNQKHFGHHHNHGWHPHVSVNFGSGPYYGNYYGNGYYSNYYSSKKAARYALKRSANVIREALQFSNWNDTYSPWLAKAIRHQQYAKQQYFWGNYAGAINHSERAGFLAWNTLSYFNNDYGYHNNGFDNYDDGYGYSNYQDPYQDPNNPYYRKNNSSANGSSNNDKNTDVNSGDEDFGYKLNSSKKANTAESNEKSTETPSKTETLKKAELDTQLPEAKVTDKELLKIDAKELDIE